MKVTGGCHCGALRYEADIDPEKIAICHCVDCQVLSGTAFRTAVRVSTANFSLLTGEPKTYTKSADNGTPRIMAFCENCGTQIYGTGVGDGANQISLRVGTCDERAELVPVRQIWRRSAVHWVDDLGVCESHDKGA